MCSPSFARVPACRCGPPARLPLLAIGRGRSAPTRRVEMTGSWPRSWRCGPSRGFAPCQAHLQTCHPSHLQRPGAARQALVSVRVSSAIAERIPAPDRSELQSGNALAGRRAPVQDVGTALARRPNELSRDDLRLQRDAPTMLAM